MVNYVSQKLLLGTLNQAKINSIRVALASLPIEILTLADLNINAPVIEDGKSTQENAEKKARAYFTMTGIPTLAIDGGLHIEKFPLEKQPATMVRRIGGVEHDATDEQVLAYYQN